MGPNTDPSGPQLARLGRRRVRVHDLPEDLVTVVVPALAGGPP
ncbi:hypothetical protein [Saccharopolyspora aridisoli]|nr:hypothetical protein [Saccharopolyspora aridisoli]